MPLFNFFRLYELLFAFTMFFAAGAVADTGAGGGAGDGGSGAGDGGDGGVGGDGEVSTTGGADGTAGDGAESTTTEDSGATHADPNAPVDLGDGRTVPAKIAKLFEAAKAQGVEKEVKQLYFADQALKRAIPGGVKAAIQLAEQVEQFGGVEGIEQLQSDLETYHEDSELFERGDPNWIETAFQENPEAALKAFNNSLGYVADKHPEHYDHVMAKVVLDTLDNGSPIATIYALLANSKDNATAQDAAKKLAEWYNRIKDTASKVPEKKIDAREKALSDKEAKIQEREMQGRFKEVNAQIFPTMRSQVMRTLEGEAKLAGVDLKKLSTDYPGEYSAMLGAIQKQVQETAIKDQRFVDKHYALVQKGDLKRAAAAVNAKHEKIVPEIVRRVAQNFGLLKTKKTANTGDKGKAGTTANTGTTQAAGYTRVNQKPANHLIDYGKTSQAMQLDGKYILKDGKRVQVAY